MLVLRRLLRRPWLVLIFLGALYTLLFQKYRPYDVDNAWFLSFSYSQCEEHIETDQFRQVRFPAGMDGTHLFGKLAAIAQCVPLRRIGWLPRYASFIGITFALASLGFWWAALSCWHYNSAFASCFILLLGLSGPFVGMTQVFRYEFFSFFLSSLALWLVAKRWAFPALFISCLAVETEPAALASVLAIVIILAAQKTSWWRLGLRILAAALPAILVYAALHPHALKSLGGIQGMDQQFVPGGLLRTYYLEHRRHLVELGVLIAGAFLFSQHRGEREPRGLGWVAFALMLFFLVLPHANPYYLIFGFPFWLLIALIGYTHTKRWFWLPVCLTFIWLAEYGYRYKINLHAGYGAADIARVSNAIKQVERTNHLDDQQVSIVGEPSLWYAHPRHYTSASAFTSDLQHANLYLCYPSLLQGHDPDDTVTCGMLQHHVSKLVFVAEVEVKGTPILLYRRGE